MQPTPPLTNLQLELLKVFSRPVPDEDLLAIRQLLSNYFAQKAVSMADEIWQQQGFTEETLEHWQQTHLRTPYKPTQAGDATS